jgi:hypothetical protein
MTYRLHVDIPLDGDEEVAIQKAKAILDWWVESKSAKADLKNMDVSSVNYRLGHDDDRQRSNYLFKNENGHVNNKKCRVTLDTPE